MNKNKPVCRIIMDMYENIDAYQEVSRSADIAKTVIDLEAARQQQRGGDSK